MWWIVAVVVVALAVLALWTSSGARPLNRQDHRPSEGEKEHRLRRGRDGGVL